MADDPTSESRAARGDDHLWGLKLVLLTTLAGVALTGVLLGLDPMPQPLAYHDFADQRGCLGIPHFQNVISNVPFLVIGLAGLRWLRRWDAELDPDQHPAYVAFFAGLTATALGSMHYHWAPSSAALLWDRLPIAVAFMGLFAAIIGETMGPGFGRRMLLPLLLCGAGSVVYWRMTDDLRLYALTQFLPLLAIPLLHVLFDARFTRGRDLLASIGCYILAKGFEELDRQIYSLAAITSGHALKHLTAAIGAWIVLRMLLRRQRA